MINCFNSVDLNCYNEMMEVDMFKFIRFYLNYRRKKWYMKSAFTMQLAMIDKEEFIVCENKHDNGKIERITYKLHSVE